MINRQPRSQSLTTLSPTTADAVPPRVLFFGLRCAFTRIVVDWCRQGGVDVVALLVPGPPGLARPAEVRQVPTTLPMVGGESHEAQVRTFQINSPGSSETRALVARLEPGIIAVACYPRRIPQRTVEIARVEALNVHPSRLPAGRGPDPLFWTLRRGDGRAAVTVHAITDAFDAGPIYAQQEVRYADGTTESALEATLAKMGGRLLARTVAALATGDAASTPQDEAVATYEPWPEADDYVIHTDHSARAAYNFIRGAAGRGNPITIVTGAGSVAVAEAVAIGADGESRQSAEPGSRWIRFAQGWLLVRERPPDGTGGILAHQR